MINSSAAIIDMRWNSNRLETAILMWVSRVGRENRYKEENGEKLWREQSRIIEQVRRRILQLDSQWKAVYSVWL